jgi:hypothetical protein
MILGSDKFLERKFSKKELSDFKCRVCLGELGEARSGPNGTFILDCNHQSSPYAKHYSCKVAAYADGYNIYIENIGFWRDNTIYVVENSYWSNSRMVANQRLIHFSNEDRFYTLAGYRQDYPFDMNNINLDEFFDTAETIRLFR